jgi:choline dehydrogenase
LRRRGQLAAIAPTFRHWRSRALKGVGVEPRVENREVGRNLQDHLGVYLKYRCKEPITLYSLFRPDRAIAASLQALLFGKGPATSIPLEAGGFLKTRPDLDIPDIHITFVPGLNLETTRAGQGQHGYLINFYQLRPESRGEVMIASANPTQAPLIDPNYLDAEADRRCMRDGVRLAQKIGANPVLARHDA